MRRHRADRALLAASRVLLLAAVVAAGAAGCRKAAPGPETAAAPDLGTIVHAGGESVALATEGGSLVVPDRILVSAQPGEGARAIADAAAAAVGGTVVSEISYIGLFAVAVDAPDEAALEAAAAKAAAVAGVEGASADPIAVPHDRVEGVECSVIKDDPVYAGANARPYEMIGAERAWKVIRAAGVERSPVQVGVTDDGLYRGQGEFGGKSKVKSTHADDEFAAPDVHKDGTPRVYGSHGTAVTGIIGADPDNGGQAGVASVLGEGLTVQHTNIFSAKYGRAQVPTDLADVTQIQWTGHGSYAEGNIVALLEQVKAGSKVINCSWGIKEPTDDAATKLVSAAYRRFFQQMSKDHPDVVFVIAAGNEHQSVAGDQYWPAGAPFENVVTVGCLENDGSKVGYSNSAGPDFEVTLAAPGHKVVSGVDANGKVSNNNGGTSFAAPQVTSAVALMQSIDPKLSAKQIKQILRDTMTAEFKDDKTGAVTKVPAGVGGGCVAVDRAVLKVVNAVRTKRGLAPLTMDQVEALNSVSLFAEGAGAGPWSVVAGAKGPGTDTSVEIRVEGQAAVGGDGSQPVREGGSAKWDVTVSGDPVTVHAKRADTGACSRVKIGEDPWVGLWTWKAWYGFGYRMTITRTDAGYAGTTNSAVGSTVRIEGDTITVTSSFRDMFGTNTETWKGKLQDGAIVGTFSSTGSSGSRQEPWRATKAE